MTTNSEARRHPIPLLKRWAMVLNGCNVPELELADSVTKWLVISRACVFSMTFTSGLIGVLIAAEAGPINWWLAILAIIGLVAAHAANNLINDWTDVRKGVDTEDYPRAQYSVHPLLGGLTTPRGLLQAALLLNLLDAVIMVYLTIVRGPLVIAFAVGGLLLSLTYTNALKRYALGELTSLVVWGPLMIAGTAYVASGTLSPAFWAASLPYGLIVASVLVGKHIDKIEPDSKVGVRSVPVVLGETASLRLNKVLFILFYVLVIALVVLRFTGPWVLLSFLALPRLRMAWKVYSEPKPAEPPEEWTVWPLWYVGWAMYFNRQAGEFFVLGMLMNILMPTIVYIFS
ncbi:MAG: prenyltransferase [Chloroflexi bacterium]|nr:prenyltransferase [Chloroflexota bacterium]